MSLDLEKLQIIIPKIPERTWECNGRDWEEYRILALDGNIEAGHILISRDITNPPGTYIGGTRHKRKRSLGKKSLAFWFNTKKEPINPLPVVCFHGRKKPYEGRGICRKLLIDTNEYSKTIWQEPLYSDTLFVTEGAKNIWFYLEKEGLAVSCLFYGKDRWRML